jgi:hypothetical protein
MVVGNVYILSRNVREHCVKKKSDVGYMSVCVIELTSLCECEWAIKNLMLAI